MYIYKVTNIINGKNNPMYGKRFKWMNKDGIRKHIELNEVDKHLNEGWNLGRGKNN